MKELNDANEKALELLGIKKTEWIKIIHKNSELLPACCEKCQSINGCKFLSKKMPFLPVHERCHCNTRNIRNPIPNMTAFAICDIRKFTNYIFTGKGEDNGKKALFESWGYAIMDSEKLQVLFEQQAVKKYCDGDYALGIFDDNGQRITIIIELSTPVGIKTIKSGWMVHPNGNIRLTTPFGGYAQ